jgi:hypothetical protein
MPKDAPFSTVPEAASKLAWAGTVLGVQPRIRLTRSFNQSSHTYQGFVLRIAGKLGEEERPFVVGLGKGAHEKHGLRAGDRVSGLGEAVADPVTEITDIYKVTKLTVEHGDVASTAPPWTGVPPALEVYRARGHRRLDAKVFASSCTSCIWGCEMAVEMIIDQWNPSNVRWRRETLCYGPKSCPLYKAGPKRKVPGRKGISWTEEDWIDEEATAHRGPEE